jgi:hypothetical protein
MNITKLQDALANGHNDAATLNTGDEFLGAFGHAKVQGYVQHTPEFDLFVAGFLGALADRFPVGVFVKYDSNVLTSIPVFVPLI